MSLPVVLAGAILLICTAVRAYLSRRLNIKPVWIALSEGTHVLMAIVIVSVGLTNRFDHLSRNPGAGVTLALVILFVYGILQNLLTRGTHKSGETRGVNLLAVGIMIFAIGVGIGLSLATAWGFAAAGLGYGTMRIALALNAEKAKRDPRLDNA